MKNLNITILLAVLALLSLFTGISINKNLSFLYQYSFVDGPEMLYYDILHHSIDWALAIHWSLTAFVHTALLLLPLYYWRKWAKKLIFYLPLTFIICEFFYLTLFVFILIPFIIVWVTVLIMSKQQCQ